MEVHHHSHPGRKRFKEYFLEFVMIFLAVTLGFFAESIREHIRDDEHAKFLTKQLVKDLETDTLNLAEVINFDTKYQKTLDTLFFELQHPVETVDTKHLQQLIFNSYYADLFNPSTGAIAAIEKELNLKQFSTSDIPGLITNYQSKIVTAKAGEDLILRLIEQNVEPFIYAHISPQNAYNAFSKGGPASDASIRNLKQDDMTELSVKLQLIAALINDRIHWLMQIKSDAVKIIQYIK